MAGHEVLDMLRNGDAVDIAADLNFCGDLSRHVVGSMFKGVECHNAHRVVELPGHQSGNDRFEVRLLNFGFAVNAPELSEAINYEVNGLVCTVGHNPWRPTGARHTHFLRNKMN
jgi:hypothetical protein